MAQQDINQILESERQGATLVRDAEQQAKEIVKAAESQGMTDYSQVSDKQQKQLSKRLQQEEASMEGQVRTIREEYEAECKKLEAQAKTNLRQVVEYICKKVVE